MSGQTVSGLGANPGSAGQTKPDNQGKRQLYYFSCPQRWLWAPAEFPLTCWPQDPPRSQSFTQRAKAVAKSRGLKRRAVLMRGVTAVLDSNLLCYKGPALFGT